MTEEIYFRGVHNVTEFTRNELFVSFRQGGYQLSEASFYKKVEDMVNDGEIVRVGRNHYCLPNDKRQVYRLDNSELAELVAWQLVEQYPYLNFTFFDIGSTKAKQYGFLMEYDNGKKLVFAGDEPLKENGKKYSKNVDWLLSEAFCLFDEEPKFHAYQYQHQTVKEASMIAQDLKVKNLLIWHTEDQTGKKRKERYTEEAKQFYKGNVWVPEDGEVFNI